MNLLKRARRRPATGRTPSTSTIFVDESGTPFDDPLCFVVAAVKVRAPGTLARAIRSVRDRYGFWDEFKFCRAGPATLSVLSEVVDVLEVSDVQMATRVVKAQHVGITGVLEGRGGNPFGPGKSAWRVQADLTSQLLGDLICPDELVCLCMDDVSTPVLESFEERVRTLTNDRTGRLAVVSALTLNSEASDLLQLARPHRWRGPLSAPA